MHILTVQKLRFWDNFLRRKLPPKFNPNPHPNPNPYRGALFFGGNCPDTRKYITLCLCSLLSNWKYFKNKYCNLPFLAICRSQFPLLIFLASSWFQRAKIALQMRMRNKKNMINYPFKGLCKTINYRTKYNISQVFFLLTGVWVFFLFSYQSVFKFWKIEKISSVSFHCT